MKKNDWKKIVMGVTLIFGLIMSVNSIAEAADDPSIKGKLRADIQLSMKKFIDNYTVDGVYRLYDPVTGKLFRLKLEKLHEGIVKKGDFYVSCADFRDGRSGKVVDVDFMVLDKKGEMITTQGIVHKADGKKRKYHLED